MHIVHALPRRALDGAPEQAGGHLVGQPGEEDAGLLAPGGAAGDVGAVEKLVVLGVQPSFPCQR